MADETLVVKDPTQKKFWRSRNITLLIMTAALPALIGWAWSRSSEAVTNYFARQRAQDERIKALEDDTRERLKELENDHANNKAIWDAITDEKNRITEQEIELRVMRKLFDREFGHARPAQPSATPEPPPAEGALPKPPPVKPDQYRLEKELLNPQQKKK